MRFEPSPLRRTLAVVAAASLTAIVTANAGPGGELPGNIVVDTALEDVVAGMLVDSTLFRSQCERLGEVPGLGVDVIVDAPGAETGRLRGRAEGVISRYEFGRIKATVRLWSTDHAVELIAYEMEHVLEYVEGTDYRRLSRRPGTGVWRAGPERFETARAIGAGMLVAKEVARARRRRITTP